MNQYSFDGMTVTKIGAATGSTTGVIISSRCTALNMSHLIAVRCPDSSQKFADRCDSGALVVGRSGSHDTDPVAVGLVEGGDVTIPGIPNCQERLAAYHVHVHVCVAYL